MAGAIKKSEFSPSSTNTVDVHFRAGYSICRTLWSSGSSSVGWTPLLGALRGKEMRSRQQPHTGTCAELWYGDEFPHGYFWHYPTRWDTGMFCLWRTLGSIFFLPSVLPTLTHLFFAFLLSQSLLSSILLGSPHNFQKLEEHSAVYFESKFVVDPLSNSSHPLAIHSLTT